LTYNRDFAILKMSPI